MDRKCAYDQLDRRNAATYGNGTIAGYSYDAVGRLSVLAQNPSGTSHDLTLGFAHNPASGIANVTRANDSYAWGGHYAVNRNYTANGLNQYSAAGSITPTYDRRGNLTSAGSTTYGYSSDNMLTSASGGITLTYDPLLRLYETAGGSTTRLAYDGQSLIAEYNGSNTLLRRYVHGPGVDEPLVWYEGTGTSDRRWLHADERGSIVAVSNASGAVTNINSYDESGIPASTNAGRFQYTGQQWIAELGMYHYRARFYSPTLGRFLQTDPIGYGDGMNLYAYVGNDPVNFTDPSGLGPDDPPCTDCTGPEPVVIGTRRSGGGVIRSGGPNRPNPRRVMENPGGSEGGPSETECPNVPESRPIGDRGLGGATLRDPTGAIAANEIRHLANEAAANRFPISRGTGDMRDAYRHFYWSFGMARVLGAGRAIAFGNANEVSGANPPRERDMDTYSNAVAIAMAGDPRYRNMPTAEVAEIAMANGCLRVIR